MEIASGENKVIKNVIKGTIISIVTTLLLFLVFALLLTYTNISETTLLDPEARITYISETGAEPEIVTVDELMGIVTDNGFDPLEEGNEKLFDVYTMGGTALMALAKEMPVIE